MKFNHPYLIAAAAVQLMLITTSYAQSSKTETLLPPPPQIAIDGDVKEWGDSLRYYNTEKHINYSIANTKDTLYMAIRVNDRSEQTRILRAGITFSIDPKGKKKETYSVTFPLNVPGSAPLPDLKKDEVPGDITQEDRDELIHQRITNLRGIKVEGFKDVEGDMITTSNTYGFQTAVNYDKDGYLVCEAAIPMSFFHADGTTKNEWAFNFKINGLQKKAPAASGDDQPAGGGGHGGRGGGGGFGGSGGGGGRGGHGGKGGSHNADAFVNDGPAELFKSEDFWEKYYLAK